MTNTAPMALMAAALFLAMHGGGAGKAGAAECPCAFTADVLSPEVWEGRVECTVSKIGAQTQLVKKGWDSQTPIFVVEHYLGGGCTRIDGGGTEAMKERSLSQEERLACSREIIEYAQRMKDLKEFRVRYVVDVDGGCGLK